MSFVAEEIISEDEYPKIIDCFVHGHRLLHFSLHCNVEQVFE
jgi:hypothetical protein